MHGLAAGTMLRAGWDYWRKEPAARVAFLVDGQNYFAALRAACLAARRVIRIVGWDIHSRMRLVPEASDGLPAELGPFLNALLRLRRHLRIDVLIWDFAMIYSIEREALPLLNREWRRHGRLRLRFAADHPLGASHHQKIVTIDDTLAFVGGIDLTMRRWDTPAHAPHDARRRDPAGTPYPPFHDLHMAVDGPAAAALAELARERWRGAIGAPLPPAEASLDPWPSNLAPDLRNVEVAIARTAPAFGRRPERREVEHLWCAGIAAAQRTLYIETQYLTAGSIAAALQRRLAEPAGPEIVIVLPRHCHGWLEEAARADCPARLVHRLRAADRHDRLRLFFPEVLNGAAEPTWVRVHSKALVVDDRLLRLGSSNLSNRSMGVDTECDVAIEGTDDATRRGIAGFRDRLLGEHLGQTPASVAAAVAAHGFIGGIERLSTGARRLLPLVDEAPLDLVADGADGANLFDPQRPIRPERFIDDFLPEALPRPALWWRMTGWMATALLFAALVAVWRYTPLAQLLTLQGLVAAGQGWAASPWTPLVVGGAFVLGGFVMVPVTLMIAASGILFGPVAGLLYAALGVLSSASAGFFVGRMLGRGPVRRLAGTQLSRIGHRLAVNGIVTMTVLRLLPIAPFVLVNLVAGAMRLRFRDFFLGTALGTAPGIVAMTLLGVSAARVLYDGDTLSILLLIAVILVLAALGYALQRWLGIDEAALPVRE